MSEQNGGGVHAHQHWTRTSSSLLYRLHIQFSHPSLCKQPTVSPRSAQRQDHELSLRFLPNQTESVPERQDPEGSLLFNGEHVPVCLDPDPDQDPAGAASDID